MGILTLIVDCIHDNMTTCLVFLLVFLVLWKYFRPSPWRLPPGPRPWPIIGNMNPLKLSTFIGDVEAFELARKYNTPILYQRWFGMNMVTLHSYDLVKEVFTSDKMVDRVRQGIDKWFNRGIIQVSGQRWVEQRRFTLSTLRDFGLGKNKIEKTIQEEITELFENLDNKKGESFEPTSLLTNAISNIICSMIFGHRFDYDDTTFKNMLRMMDENIEIHMPPVFFGTIIPFANWLPGDVCHVKRLEKNLKYMQDEVFGPEFRKHLENHDPNNMNDFMDVFINEIKKREDDNETEHWFTEEQLGWVIEDLFLAGTETSSSTMRWAFLSMLHYPDVQMKVRKEIHDVIGKERLVSMKDRLNLPYTEAVLLEIQRMHIITPYGMPHCNRDDPMEIEGYLLPPQCNVAVNFYSIHYDPDYWDQPEIFNPDRFIGEDGKFKRDEHVMPFSIGKRSCLGEPLARMELFLFFASLLQRYRIALATGQPLPSMERNAGGIIKPNPYNVCFIKDC
ncbi:unnamed protein product [Owenia fusiformis]|uniref:Uncharacterized protein n=1 Tax=Owenia fusiformis TaxID=6347 RepID=A0A8J1Y814_OWEFU|nr:unnamed protein product [Owenia fusiformis]